MLVAYSPNSSTLKTKPVRPSETSVYSYQITISHILRCDSSEYLKLHTGGDGDRRRQGHPVINQRLDQPNFPDEEHTHNSYCSLVVAAPPRREACESLPATCPLRA
jgi:hypothetical protein